MPIYNYLNKFPLQNIHKHAHYSCANTKANAVGRVVVKTI